MKILPIKVYSTLFILLMGLFNCTLNTPDKTPLTWAEKLGFPSDKKVLILHADDVGMCEEANLATAAYLDQNHIQSAAIMMPCPNAHDFIQWAIEHPDKDIGLHLTLTSEWKNYRWGPVSDTATVPGLVDPDKKFWHEVPDVVQHASAAEVEKEIRAQIDASISLGYTPTHIDSHMGTLFGKTDYLEVFLKVAMEYNIPANAIELSNPEVVEKFKKIGYPIDEKFIATVEKYTLPKLDNFTAPPKADTYKDKLEKFKHLVDSLEPGLTEIIFHPSVKSDNLKSITNSWQQRVWEAQMFSDPDLINYLKKEGVIFTNWKEIMKRFNETKS